MNQSSKLSFHHGSWLLKKVACRCALTMPAEQATRPRERMAARVIFVRVLICKLTMIGIGIRAKQKSVTILMTLLNTPMLAKTWWEKHFVVGSAARLASHEAAIGMQLKIKVPAEANPKQIKKTAIDTSLAFLCPRRQRCYCRIPIAPHKQLFQMRLGAKRIKNRATEILTKMTPNMGHKLR